MLCYLSPVLLLQPRFLAALSSYYIAQSPSCPRNMASQGVAPDECYYLRSGLESLEW